MTHAGTGLLKRSEHAERRLDWISERKRVENGLELTEGADGELHYQLFHALLRHPRPARPPD
jgi:hypothetical protein